MKTRFLKLLSVILTVLMISGSVSVALAAPAGAGTENDPVVIANAEDFAALAADPAAYDGKYITLAGDIDLSTLGTAYTPIGTQAVPFKGVFDGCGYAIKGGSDVFYLTRNRAVNNCGLFGYTSGAVIKNVTLTKLALRAGTNAGLLLGYGESTQISNIKVTGSCPIEANENAGGIVGTLASGSIVDCRNESTSSVEVSDGDNAGGIVGLATDAQILRCINKCSVNTMTANCGGIAGRVSGSVSHCLNLAAVSSEYDGDADSAGVAGIVGFFDGPGTVTYCGNSGDITSALDCFGIVCYGPDADVSYCYNAGMLDWQWDPGASWVKSENNCVYRDDASVTVDDMKDQATYEAAGWYPENGENVWMELPADAVYHNYPYPVLIDCNFHQMEESVTRPATCTETERTRYYCGDVFCDYEYFEDTAPALGHQMITVTTVKATCVNDGETVQQCSRVGCGYTDEATRAVVPATGEHNDADGDNECDVCGKIMKEPEQQQEVKKNFFQKIIDFFKRIFDWIKNLFTRNKE